jgi:hypothetical protein
MMLVHVWPVYGDGLADAGDHGRDLTWCYGCSRAEAVCLSVQ